MIILLKKEKQNEAVNVVF